MTIYSLDVFLSLFGIFFFFESLFLKKRKLSHAGRELTILCSQKWRTISVSTAGIRVSFRVHSPPLALVILNLSFKNFLTEIFKIWGFWGGFCFLFLNSLGFLLKRTGQPCLLRETTGWFRWVRYREREFGNNLWPASCLSSILHHQWGHF